MAINPFVTTLFVDTLGFREANLEWALPEIILSQVTSINPNYIATLSDPNACRLFMNYGHAAEPFTTKGVVLTTLARRWFWSATAPRIQVVVWNGKEMNRQSPEYWALRIAGLDHTKARGWVTKPPKKLRPIYDSAMSVFSEPMPEVPEYVTIREPDTLDYDKYTLGEYIDNQGQPMAFDIETTGLDFTTSNLLGISVSVGQHSGRWAAYNHIDGSRLGEVYNLLRQHPTITHNGGFDWGFLKAHGVNLPPPTHDTKILAYLLGYPNTELKALGKSVLGRSVMTYADATGDEDTLEGVPEDELIAYACQDADITYSLYEKFTADLPQSMEELYREVEMPVLPILRDMTSHGALVDKEFVTELKLDTEEKLASLAKVLYLMTGEEFEISSNVEVGRILFDKLGLPVLRTNKSGPKVDTWVFEELDHPVVDIIDSWREHNKLLSTYIKPILTTDGDRVHGRFHQTVTQTGRLSSSGPNLQNQDPRIRKAYIAPPGGALIVADYSQQELRVLAHYSQDPEWLRWYREGIDAHDETVKLLNCSRKTAKLVNFGIAYGAGVGRIAKQARIPMAQASQILAAHRATYRGVWDWIADAHQLAQARGYAETLWGRRRYLDGFQSDYPEEVESAKRMAANMPIQGTAADITKAAMVAVTREICDDRCVMILQVHDELVFEVKDYDYAGLLVPKIKAIMESVGAGKLTVPLIVDPKICRNWGEGK